ncbi:MAG: nitroreductase family deazaflavin-dependent oxidoreductase [Chloroflexi bacterium]|nr:nitroreductase family deazaflavin-dependent oxidoreductase [Chloroflexota bacterium]
MSNIVRRSFWVFNKLFMVPMFRLGFGPFIGNSITGYIMVLKTVGRKTGKARYTPVNYAVHKGNVYCMAGWGRLSDWYRNMIATREVETILPSGSLFGVVEDVTDLEERRIILRKILQNAGFAGFFEGFNPFNVTDEVLMRKTAEIPLVRIHPVGIGNGASDPGGLSWLWMPISIILIVLIIIALCR